MRAAIYVLPAPDSDLGRAGALWLGRDAFTGRATRAQDPSRDPWLSDPARYGFHATLKAPFRLKDEASLPAIAARLGTFCAGRPPPVIRSLALARLGAFFALGPAEPEPAVASLEADALDAFEPFRAPLTEAELAARRPDRLSPRQLAHLHRWGYPFVLDEFRFHMTLTNALGEDAERFGRDLRAHFAAVLGRPLPLDGLGLCIEPAPGAPFRVHAFHPFGPPAALQPATTP